MNDLLDELDVTLGTWLAECAPPLMEFLRASLVRIEELEVRTSAMSREIDRLKADGNTEQQTDNDDDG